MASRPESGSAESRVVTSTARLVGCRPEQSDDCTWPSMHTALSSSVACCAARRRADQHRRDQGECEQRAAEPITRRTQRRIRTGHPPSCELEDHEAVFAGVLDWLGASLHGRWSCRRRCDQQRVDLGVSRVVAESWCVSTSSIHRRVEAARQPHRRLSIGRDEFVARLARASSAERSQCVVSPVPQRVIPGVTHAPTVSSGPSAGVATPSATYSPSPTSSGPTESGPRCSAPGRRPSTRRADTSPAERRAPNACGSCGSSPEKREP